ncbi:hypothetical protein KFU94_15845 [Chloroflexi bacterium TSY]|nr:hypothetical protein [Chloroflexi bacterium TSY]
MPDSTKLAILTDLRKEVKLTLADMARQCGLTGRQSHQTAGEWERGEITPRERTRRRKFIHYLWNDLRLRQNPEQFEAIWTLLMQEWRWNPLTDEEQRLLELNQSSGFASSMNRRPSTNGVMATSNTPSDHVPVFVDGQPSNPKVEWNGSDTVSLSDTEPSTTSSHSPFQAPAPTPHFVGRQDELFALQARLTQGLPPRIYALVGMGGAGKTTLVAQLAQCLRNRFSNGVLWGYAASSDPLSILGNWATAYGYDFGALSDLQNRAAAVRGVLADKETLLVIDDATSIERVRYLLPNSDRCAVLLTTRSEEVAIGLGAEVIQVSELTPVDGLQLLTNILGDARVRAEVEAAQEICTLLHHLPLAVEIAAQYLAPRPRRRLADMADHLRSVQNRLDLKISDRDVRTSFSISWDALDDEHRITFAHMAVFEGRSFTADALAALLDLDLFATQDRLEMLKALSLVWEEGEERYRQHPLLADFALEQLDGERQPQLRLLDFYQKKPSPIRCDDDGMG